MVIIRLRRMGAKLRPFYRVVVTDSRNRKVGKYIASVGTYDPHADPPAISLDLDGIKAWQSKGAAVSETVASLIRRSSHEGTH